MTRLTLRLPESLHEQLAARAEREGVSLNQYIVYSLTRVVSAADVAEQRRAFERLLSRFPDEEANGSLRELLATRKKQAS